MKFKPDRRGLAAFICGITAALFVISCFDTGTVWPPPPGPGLKIDVDSTLVTVSWNPRYKVNKLQIVADTGVWFISDENGLLPPVAFGVAPPGAQVLRPTPREGPFPPDGYYAAVLIRSKAKGDHIVANGSVGGPPMDLPTLDGESGIYSPGVVPITPPGVIPEVFEFTGLAAVPNAAWKHLHDEDEVENLLNVRPVIVVELFRDANGVQRIAEYEDLRAANVEVDGGITSIIWDQVIP